MAPQNMSPCLSMMIHARKSLLFQEYLGQIVISLFRVSATAKYRANQDTYWKTAAADSLSQLIMSNGILAQLDYLTRHK